MCTVNFVSSIEFSIYLPVSIYLSIYLSISFTNKHTHTHTHVYTQNPTVVLPVDSLNLGRTPSAFLQQAAHLTGGVYISNPRDQRDSLQHLMTYCVASTHTRQCLKTLPLRTVDFKASCHCHGRSVEFSYMCSVCLSLTCAIEEGVTTSCQGQGQGQSQAEVVERRCKVCETPIRGV